MSSILVQFLECKQPHALAFFLSSQCSSQIVGQLLAVNFLPTFIVREGNEYRIDWLACNIGKSVKEAKKTHEEKEVEKKLNIYLYVIHFGVY